MTMTTSRTLIGAARLSVLATAACGGGGNNDATDEAAASSATAAASSVTVENCGTDVEFPSPAERLYAYDGGMISMVLAIGAVENVAGIAGLDDDEQVMERAYGALTSSTPCPSPSRTGPRWSTSSRNGPT